MITPVMPVSTLPVIYHLALCAMLSFNFWYANAEDHGGNVGGGEGGEGGGGGGGGQSLLSWRRGSGPPWTSAPGTQFPYKGFHNDLDGLLAVQHRGGWVTMTTWSTGDPVKRFGLNFFFSLYTYGQQQNVVIGALNEDTLSECDRLNLPCFNLSMLFTSQVSNKASEYGSSQNLKIYSQARAFASAILDRVGACTNETMPQ